MESFKRQNKKCLQKLSKIKSSPEEDENLLVETLDYAMRNELVMLRSIFLFSDSLTKKLFLQKIKISPKAKILGISSPSTPDFVIPEISAIGDIKTGREFKEFFPLTAAGYALAYENEHGMGNDINFGLIYFFPTRQKYISFANVYIFLIDDKLRSYFLTKRDEAFLMLKKAKDKINPEEPLFADESKYCHDCKFKDDCCTLKKEKRKKK
jgi:CRISPR/Cas system-associated exonuclease Cas4 (RecB family)